MLVSCLASSSTLKVEVTCSTKTSVDFQQTAWCHIPEDITFHIIFLGWLFNDVEMYSSVDIIN
jgi:hypothetical protein